MATAILASAQGDHMRARRLQQRALEMMKRVLGEEHPNTLTSTVNLGLILLEAGENKIALGLLRKIFARQRKVIGDQHLDTIAIANLLTQLEHESESA
jgi:hypothetical protein